MPQIFSRSANGAARLALLGAVLLVSFGSTAAVLAVRSDFMTGVGEPVAQPVPFSHAHHVRDDGIDCRYCHTSVETSAFAGIPSTEICMTCHSQLFTDAAVLAPVRDSLATGQPIRWSRVNDLADFVYFNHSIHVNSGVACDTCHGPVEEMPLMRRENPMQMSWCLDCHRDPAAKINSGGRPSDARLPGSIAAANAGKALHDYAADTGRLTDCYVCHR